MTIVYSRDVIFREVRRTFETEEVREKKPKNIEFNWNEVSHDLDELNESEEVETQTTVVRRSSRARKQPDRYSPPRFHSTFALSAIEE